VLAGALVAFVLRANLVPDEQVNIFVLAAAVVTFAVCDFVLHESGTLAVIVAGMVVGATKPKQLREVKRFELELTELSIGLLFVLLAANLDPAAFVSLGWPLLAAVVGVVLVLRPIAILLSTWGTDFTAREKAFLSWIAPRGVVAASMASLFAIELAPINPDCARLLEVFTFAVIATTVILQGFSARVVARWLGLLVARDVVLVIGETPVAPAMAEALGRAGVRALALVPELPGAESTHAEAEHVVFGAPLDRGALNDPRFAEVGLVVAVTHNPFFNELISERWAENVGVGNTYRWNPLDHTLDDTGHHRRGIWPQLDPRELATELDAHRVAVDVLSPAAVSGGARTLFSIDGPRARVLETPDDTGAGDTVVGLRPRLAGLDDLVVDAMLIDEPDVSFDDVIARLLGRAAADHPGLAVDSLRASIVQRASMPCPRRSVTVSRSRTATPPGSRGRRVSSRGWGRGCTPRSPTTSRYGWCSS
jgi:hypothetical protein